MGHKYQPSPALSPILRLFSFLSLSVPAASPMVAGGPVPQSFFHTFQALFSLFPPPVSVLPFLSLSTWALALRVHTPACTPACTLPLLRAKHRPMEEEEIKSEFANVVKSRAGVLTTNADVAQSKYCRGAGLKPVLPALVLSRATTSSTNDAVSRKSRSFVSK